MAAFVASVTCPTMALVVSPWDNTRAGAKANSSPSETISGSEVRKMV